MRKSARTAGACRVASDNGLRLPAPSSKPAPILVLDEATSSLDGENERQVMAAALENMPGSTVICIAHRLSTVQAMDRILVLDSGRIVDEGTHMELTERSALYRSIFHLEPVHENHRSFPWLKIFRSGKYSNHWLPSCGGPGASSSA
jgi:ABC-type multidrug transport system ATPase subunit